MEVLEGVEWCWFIVVKSVFVSSLGWAHGAWYCVALLCCVLMLLDFLLAFWFTASTSGILDGTDYTG